MQMFYYLKIKSELIQSDFGQGMLGKKSLFADDIFLGINQV